MKKTYRVNPLNVLVNCILPMYANDAHEIILRLLEREKEQGREIPVQDGFDLYKGLSAVRRLHTEALPQYANIIFQTPGSRRGGFKIHVIC